MSLKAIIFDLDGTLLDTLDDLSDALNAMLQNLGYPTHSTETIRRLIGGGVHKLIEDVLPPEQRSQEKIAQGLQGFRHPLPQKLEHQNKTLFRNCGAFRRAG